MRHALPLLLVRALGALLLVAALAALAAGCSPEGSDAPLATSERRLHGDSPMVAALERVSAESGVPLEVLVGVAWVESRFATRPAEGSGTLELAHGHGPVGHGPMHLVEGHTLERAAALTGLELATLRSDPEANLRGAAAVLAELERETGSWDAALAAYGPGALDADAGESYAGEVMFAARYGASGVDSDGLTIAFGGIGGGDDDDRSATERSRYATLEQAARPDYPGAQWVGPSCSGNYTNASRGPAQLTDIVIHTCQGGFSGCWGWLKNCQSGVSAHYVVSSEGQIVQIVEEQDIAYHDGCFNTNSIGVEHEGFVNDPGRWYTDEMYCESAKLVRSICDRNNIPCDRAHVRGHGETPDCSTHTDPGSGWDWAKYMEYIECGCGGCCQAQTESCNGADDDCDGQVDEGDVCEVRLLENQIGAYAAPSTTDVDADGQADVCGRGASGVWCHFARTDGWSTKTATQPAWSDDSGWDDVTNYATFRMGDVNGDGHADLCARANAAFQCHLGSAGGLDGAGSGVWRDAYKDASGWDAPQYYTTFRLADVNGDGMEDLCARSSSGFACRLSDGTGFAAAFPGPDLSDASGWDRARNYGTLRMGDVDGDGRADVCARANAGMRCWLAQEGGFAASAILGPEWNNASGFNRMELWSTIRLADVDGDGRADLCARTSERLECALSTGTGFAAPILVANYSDDSGWADESNYGTLRVGDIDGDGAQDLCIRANVGMRCHVLRDGAFSTVSGPAWSDDNGWDAAKFFHTITLADVDGDRRADLCARTAAGWRCVLSQGDAFGPTWTLDEFSDAGGWGAAQYRRTLLSGGPACRPEPELCNGTDDDCDGEIDEGEVCAEPEPDSADDTAPDLASDTSPDDASDTHEPTDTAAGPDSDATLGDAPAASDTGPLPADASADTATDSLPGDPLGSSEEGCGCRALRGTGQRSPSHPWPLAAALLAALAILARRRKPGRR